jgi:hypothetical protein
MGTCKHKGGCQKQSQSYLKKIQKRLTPRAGVILSLCVKHHKEKYGDGATKIENENRRLRTRNKPEQCARKGCKKFRRSPTYYCAKHQKVLRLSPRKHGPQKKARSRKCDGRDLQMCCPDSAKCTQCMKAFRFHSGKVKKSKSGIEGHGLFAREKIVKGEMLLPYTGKMHYCSYDELKKKKGVDMRRMMEVERGVYIDGGKYGGLGKYANHSCSPSASLLKLEKRDARGATRKRVAIVARVDIDVGEEITIAYGSNALAINNGICNCGHENCTGRQ